MAVYSIADLEKLTGIKAHTIRIWEKRFNFVQPKRTATNIRYYDDLDLKKVTSIALLSGKGYKISNICNMSLHELEGLVAQHIDVARFNADMLDALTLSILYLDELKFIHILNKHIEKNGFEIAFNELILPLLDKLNDMWLSGSIKKAQEEFALQIIKRKIVQQINLAEYHSKEGPSRFLLVMPKHENQQLNRLFVEYMLVKNNMASLYMSNDADLKDVIEAVDIFRADHIITFINESSSMEYADHLVMLNSKLEKPVNLVFIGYLSTVIKEKYPEVLETRNYSSLLKFLTGLKIPD